MKTSKQLEHITVANSKSPLLRLPAEIRNQIFELAFTSPSPSSTIHILYQTCTGTARDDLAIQLPFTCRQLYAETANMVYSLNTFLFVRQYHMEEWLAKRLPVQRELIEQITVCTDYMSATCGGYPTRMSVLRSAFLAAKPMCPNLKRVTDPAYLPLAGGI
ncbi:hypothetical protein BDV95DRAFT_564032 [Massariosphaeria phaeospora]|uniref:DUF7730 domain-containing protein n=1 Tax=Massariosphaeria phaeospora TaxID=100035 RepID=A0A7C8IB09_9PLEO|nr:hypothetical protein BDV95DRAFT_564032 [Massariosphaeria phaeospora]